MVQPIMRDPLFLAVESEEATRDDLQVAQDLRDTLICHLDHCVGMAANMIGVRKRIIAVDDGHSILIMFNPEIERAQDEYETQEGCLSLDGLRPCRRFRKIQVRYQTERMQTKRRTFKDYTAQIIQHEIDHTNGVLI